MNVVFSNTNFQGRVEYTSLISVVPPLELAQCAALVREQVQGVSVSIVDANVMGYSEEEHHRELIKRGPDVVVFSAATHSINCVGRMVENLKGTWVRSVLIGAHATALSEQTLKEIPGLDVVVRGEPEETVAELIDAWTKGDSLEEIPGLAYRATDGDVVRTNKRGFLSPLDSLPFPARDLLPNTRYSSPYAHGVTALRTTRGCPGMCTFCDSHLMFGCRTRLRSPRRVVDEMSECADRYGTLYFAIIDHTFTASRDFVRGICHEIIARRLDRRIRWVCNTRVDMLDDDLLRQMKRAGCLQVGIGMESSDDEGLAAVRKGITEAQLTDAIDRIKRNGILAMGYAIVGFPEDTRDSILRTSEKIFRFNPHTLQLSFATPLPGTRLWAQCLKEDRILSDSWDDYVFLRKSIIRNDTLSTEELERLRNGIVRDFYLRPGKVAKLGTFMMMRARVEPLAAATAARKVLTNLLLR